eukprot:SAG31_NODE_42407_length_271_cov_5.848837_1_plen_80_part_01
MSVVSCGRLTEPHLYFHIFYTSYIRASRLVSLIISVLAALALSESIFPSLSILYYYLSTHWMLYATMCTRVQCDLYLANG